MSRRRRDPDPIEAADIVQKPHQPRGTAGPAGETAMQADRHHFRRALAFAVEKIEAVAQIGKEIVAVGEALRVDEAHSLASSVYGMIRCGAFGPLTQ